MYFHINEKLCSLKWTNDVPVYCSTGFIFLHFEDNGEGFHISSPFGKLLKPS